MRSQTMTTEDQKYFNDLIESLQIRLNNILTTLRFDKINIGIESSIENPGYYDFLLYYDNNIVGKFDHAIRDTMELASAVVSIESLLMGNNNV